MDSPDRNALVDKGLCSVIIRSEDLEGQGWKDEWYKLLAEHEDGDVVSTELSMTELLEHDVQRLEESEKETERLEEKSKDSQTLQDETDDADDQHLRQSDFGEADLGDTRPGSGQLAFLHRTQTDTEHSNASECFVVEVACMYSAAYDRYKTSTLHLSKSMAWPQFHEQLRQHTLNWQTCALEGCAQGLTPKNGVWRYTFERQGKGVGSAAELLPVRDVESFQTMKDSFWSSEEDGDQKATFLVHDKLSDFSKEARREHLELCDRSGGSGENAVSSDGRPYEKTFDCENSWDLVRDFLVNGHPELDRRDSKAWQETHGEQPSP